MTSSWWRGSESKASRSCHGPIPRGQFELTSSLSVEPPTRRHGEPSLSLTEPLLKPSDAADLLAVRTSWIYEAVRSGTLPCLQIGRHVRFTRSMLEEWLATRTVSR
jgi:excisionase family DNA binding protein